MKSTLIVLLLAAVACQATVRGESRTEAMNRDKLGMFIHWGLYSITADGEWLMNRENLDKEDYNRLTKYFKQPKSFSPRQWTKLAKAMGAKYVVLTTRHHDGFALFDTKTTDFNSVKSAAGRDYVREFVDACRKDGLRVGLYYSIMNWQYWAASRGVSEQKVWDEQVRVTHEALRELMTNYGKIDYLWYDGCCAPGSTDGEAMDRMWRTKELNAMVRQLQPDILINDRSCQPEDYSTPEQCLTPPPRGRAWESCLTCNGMWGFKSCDDSWKSAETLFRSLLHCARFGGNLLINVGPRVDGSIPEGCTRELRKLGKMIAECPASIYGSERDAYTEATHEAGVVTKANGSYWLWALNSTNLDGVATLEKFGKGKRAYKVTLRDGAKPCDWLGGRHDVVLSAGEAPVLGDNSGRYTPPTGDVVPTNLADAVSFEFAPPSGGLWQLEVGFTNAEGYKDTCSEQVRAGGPGERFTVNIPSGKGIYATRLSPVWKTVSPQAWQVSSVLPTGAEKQRFSDQFVRKALDADLVAQSAKTAFAPVRVENNLCDRSFERVNFNYAIEKPGFGICLARHVINSDCDQVIYAAYGADWWGKVYVNGVEALSTRMGWKPTPFALRLKKGDNEILTATHCGSGQHWFDFFHNLP